MSRVIHQEITFDAPPAAVFAAIIESDKFAKVTGAPAKSSTENGAEISLFDGKITGRNVEIVPNQRIVQVWRAGNWEAGVHSLVRFEFSGGSDGTMLKFEHVGFPDGEQEHLEAGWHKMYWAPLRAFLAP